MPCSIMACSTKTSSLKPAASSSGCGRRLNPSFRSSANVLPTSRYSRTWKRRRSDMKRGRNAATQVTSPRCGNSCSRCAVRQLQRPKPDPSTDQDCRFKRRTGGRGWLNSPSRLFLLRERLHQNRPAGCRPLYCRHLGCLRQRDQRVALIRRG